MRVQNDVNQATAPRVSEATAGLLGEGKVTGPPCSGIVAEVSERPRTEHSASFVLPLRHPDSVWASHEFKKKKKCPVNISGVAVG